MPSHRLPAWLAAEVPANIAQLPDRVKSREITLPEANALVDEWVENLIGEAPEVVEARVRLSSYGLVCTKQVPTTVTFENENSYTDCGATITYVECRTLLDVDEKVGGAWVCPCCGPLTDAETDAATALDVAANEQ